MGEVVEEVVGDDLAAARDDMHRWVVGPSLAGDAVDSAVGDEVSARNEGGAAATAETDAGLVASDDFAGVEAIADTGDVGAELGVA